MKRLGLMKDIQNNMNDQTVNKKKLIIKKRHISPPPALNGSSNMGIAQEGVTSAEATNISGATDTTSGVNVLPQKIPDGKNKKLFQFPFQRRARSLSLTKDKDGNEIIDESMLAREEAITNQANVFSNKQGKKPIIAKDNFLLAHKGIVPGVSRRVKEKEREEIMLGKQKEVDDWVSQDNEDHLQGMRKSLSKQSPSIAKATGDQSIDAKDKEEDQKSENDEDQWMFRTFSKSKPKAPAPAQKSPPSAASPDTDIDDFTGLAGSPELGKRFDNKHSNSCQNGFEDDYIEHPFMSGGLNDLL